MTKLNKNDINGKTGFNFKIFNPYPNLIYGFSDKADGRMSRAMDFKTDAQGYKNRIKFLAKHKITVNKVKAAGLVHSANVAKIHKRQKRQIIPDTDGLVTGERNVFLTVTTADCFPVFIFDPNKQAVGLIHAGWRGVTSEIVIATVKEMQKYYRSNPRDLLAGIGPGIQVDHFEIKSEILQNFNGYKREVKKRGNKIFVDLPGIIKAQLLDLGLKPANIEISKTCTYCFKNRYFSFRRDKALKPMMGVIGLV